MFVIQFLSLWLALGVVTIAIYNIAKHRVMRRAQLEEQWRSRDGAS